MQAALHPGRFQKMARFVDLAEDGGLLRSVRRAPGADAPLECPTDVGLRSGWFRRASILRLIAVQQRVEAGKQGNTIARGFDKPFMCRAGR